MTSTVTPEWRGGNHSTDIHSSVHQSIHRNIYPSLTHLAIHPPTRQYLSTTCLALSYPFIHILSHFVSFKSSLTFMKINLALPNLLQASYLISMILSQGIRSHFTDLETKAQRKIITSPKVIQLECVPRSFQHQRCSLNAFPFMKPSDLSLKHLSLVLLRIFTPLIAHHPQRTVTLATASHT